MFTRFVLPFLLMAVCLGSAHAGFLFDWSSPGVQYLSDPMGDQVSGAYSASWDLLGVWYAHDATRDYFRMDLASQANSGPTYDIGFFTSPGGLDSPAYPPELQGLDAQVWAQVSESYNWSYSFDVWSSSSHWWVWGGPVTWQGDNSDVHGAPSYHDILEWSVPRSALPDQFTIIAYSWDWDDYDDVSILDETGLLQAGDTDTPEPASLALLGVGLGAFALRRRRRA